MSQPNPGSIGWIDLTVPDANQVAAFYSAVAGWQHSAVDMGGYSDYNMTANGRPVAGVCHKKGVNQDMPSVWMIYVYVTNLDESLAQCNAHGGKVVAGPKNMGTHGRFAVIEDPAGAICGLFEAAA